MTGFADWERPEAAVRVRASCPTIGGARQAFDKTYRRADLTKYDPEGRRALLRIPEVVGTDYRHESANALGKHELAIQVDATAPKRTASGSCPIQVVLSGH